MANALTDGFQQMFGVNMWNTLLYALMAMVILAVIVVIGLMIRNKRLYKYKVRIFRIREHGKVKEINAKGAYINRKSGVPLFRIKARGLKAIDLTTTPNPAHMDEDDRVYYKQIDVNTFVQMKRTIDNDVLDITAVETDVKYGAVLAVQRIKEVLRTESTLKKLAPYISLLILGIIFIIAYALLMQSCGG